MSFDEFWDDTLSIKLSDVTDQVLAESEKDTAKVTAKLIAGLLKTALSEYHAFLVSELHKT